MLFDNRQESNLRSCAQMTEEALTALGHDARAARVDLGLPDVRAIDSTIPRTGPLLAWQLQRGAAHVYVLVHAREGVNYLQVTSPVMHLEGADVDEQLLFRRLLLLNSKDLVGAAFALAETATGTDVVMLCERSTVDLDRSQVVEAIERMQAYAERYHQSLALQFGARAAGVSAAPVRLPAATKPTPPKVPPRPPKKR